MNTKQLIAKLQKSLEKNGNREVLVLDSNGRVQCFDKVGIQYCDEGDIIDAEYAKEDGIKLKPSMRCVVIEHWNT